VEVYGGVRPGRRRLYQNRDIMPLGGGFHIVSKIWSLRVNHDGGWETRQMAEGVVNLV